MAVGPLDDGRGDLVGVGVLDEGRGDGLLDDGGALDGIGLGDGHGPHDLVRLGDLDNALDVLDHLVGGIVGPLNGVGLVDGVQLGADVGDGGVDLAGAEDHAGHVDADVGDPGLLQDGVVAAHVGRGAVMDLLVDDGGALGDMDLVGLLAGLDLGGRQADVGRLVDVAVVAGSGGSAGGGKQGRKNNLKFKE